jgi:prepilin-type N-terminal cleavage/methylation domain-containing protein
MGEKYGSAGFTLLELVVVITILGILAAMVVPAAGSFSGIQHAKLTREKLEAVRAAIVGPQNTYDERGLRVVRGYAGDMDALPKLYRFNWDEANNRWDSVDDEVYNGGDVETDPEHPYIGQPCGLWEKQPAGGEDLGVLWKGPYLDYPKAVFDNRYREGFSPLWKTEGVLSDAWGRALFFIKEQDNAGDPNSIYLLVVSAGPDGMVKLPDPSSPPGPLDRAAAPSSCYDKNATENQDNIVLDIAPEEWYKSNLDAQNKQAREILEKIRTALIGPPDAFDPSGRRIVGGYIGDMGQWPALWEWNASDSEWAISSGDEGQPRSLWISEPGPFDPGFGWRGPYLSKPWGTGEDEVLRDAWGEPVKFKFEYDDLDDPQLATKLTITSSGRDKDPDTGGDNIETEITSSQWLVQGMQVKGSVRNVTPKVYEEDPSGSGNWVQAQEQPGDAIVTLKLYHRPGEPGEDLPEASVPVTVEVPAGESVPFTLPATTEYICAGTRRLEVDVTAGDLAGPVISSLIIGAWGTQSPVEEKLVILVESPSVESP